MLGWSYQLDAAGVAMEVGCTSMRYVKSLRAQLELYLMELLEVGTNSITLDDKMYLG